MSAKQILQIQWDNTTDQESESDSLIIEQAVAQLPANLPAPDKLAFAFMVRGILQGGDYLHENSTRLD